MIISIHIRSFPARSPAAGTVTYLFQRLAETSGAVQTSAVLLLARSWASESQLFRCFEVEGAMGGGWVWIYIYI